MSVRARVCLCVLGAALVYQEAGPCNGSTSTRMDGVTGVHTLCQRLCYRRVRVAVGVDGVGGLPRPRSTLLLHLPRQSPFRHGPGPRCGQEGDVIVT
jgi:hypothetical protein